MVDIFNLIKSNKSVFKIVKVSTLIAIFFQFIGFLILQLIEFDPNNLSLISASTLVIELFLVLFFALGLIKIGLIQKKKVLSYLVTLTIIYTIIQYIIVFGKGFSLINVGETIVFDYLRIPLDLYIYYTLFKNINSIPFIKKIGGLGILIELISFSLSLIIHIDVKNNLIIGGYFIIAMVLNFILTFISNIYAYKMFKHLAEKEK